MPIETFVKKFSECLEEPPSDPLSPATVFKKLPMWDSLAILTFTDTIDMDYGVLLKKADYDSSETLEDLFKIVITRA
ncbi:MAG: hypothetical protein AAGH40_01245 [Verrucomicrobiota bacterium]